MGISTSKIVISKTNFIKSIRNAKHDHGQITGVIRHREGLVYAFTPGDTIGVWHQEGTKVDITYPLIVNISKVQKIKILSVILNDKQVPSENLLFVDLNKEIVSCHKRLIDVASLQNTRVIVFGQGSVGSLATMELVRLGVPNFTLVDFDIVEPSNLSRSAYFFSDIGRRKVDAMYDKVKEVNPSAFVKTYHSDARDVINNKKEWNTIKKKSNICLVAMDDIDAQIMVSNRLSRYMPVVVAVIISGGVYGEITFVTPQTKNYCCVTNVEERKNNAPMGVSGAQAMVTDIRVVVEEAINTMVHLLQSGKSERFSTPLYADRNVIIVGRGDAEGPPEGNLKKSGPLSSVFVDTRRRRSPCRYCRK